MLPSLDGNKVKMEQLLKDGQVAPDNQFETGSPSGLESHTVCSPPTPPPPPLPTHPLTPICWGVDHVVEEPLFSFTRMRIGANAHAHTHTHTPTLTQTQIYTFTNRDTDTHTHTHTHIRK